MTVATDNNIKTGNHVAVVGAGLAGALVAALLHKQGFEVSVFEKRSVDNDEQLANTAAFGASTSAVKRSINLALSYRGIKALEQLGLVDEALSEAIRMPKRVIHSVKGEVKTQPYGKADQTLYSVGRQKLNIMLTEYLKKQVGSAVHFHNSHTLVDVDCKSGKCKFLNQKTNEVQDFTFDMIIGADGAYSAVRESMLKQGRINFQRQYVAHGYKELTIPPAADGDFALKDHEGLHIWPRGDFMLIALPNPDKSFTATLFAPQAGKDGFDHLDATNRADVLAYFQRYFPDVLPLMPTVCEDFQQNPVGSLLTVRVNPWNLGRVVLIGDAAHAVVPFYGQGMNAAFQDGLMLAQIIAEEKQQKKSGNDNDLLLHCIQRFSDERQPAANALADLCLHHYHDMASNTASQLYLLMKRAEDALTSLFPRSFRSLYSMVAFSDIPYHHAVDIAERQEAWLRRTLTISAAAVVGGVGLFSFARFARLNK